MDIEYSTGCIGPRRNDPFGRYTTGIGWKKFALEFAALADGVKCLACSFHIVMTLVSRDSQGELPDGFDHLHVLRSRSAIPGESLRRMWFSGRRVFFNTEATKIKTLECPESQYEQTKPGE